MSKQASYSTALDLRATLLSLLALRAQPGFLLLLQHYSRKKIKRFISANSAQKIPKIRRRKRLPLRL